jgi:hypothetical protein
MRWKLWTWFLSGNLIVGMALAQQTEPPKSPSPDAQIVRVRIGTDCGRCGGRYYASEISFEPALMVSIQRSRWDQKDHPAKKTEYKITKQEWEELQHVIDARVLAAFTGRIGCPGCADEGMEWAEVEFSDGTKKSVSYKHREGTNGNRGTAEKDSSHHCEVSTATERAPRSGICRKH